MNDRHVLSRLLSPGQPVVSIDQILKFVGYASQLKDLILLAQPANYSLTSNRPVLPPAIGNFIGRACHIPIDLVARFWIALAHTVWNTDIRFSPMRNSTFMSAFTTFGHDIGISNFCHCVVFHHALTCQIS